MSKKTRKKKPQRPTLVEACKLENERLSDDPNVLCVGFGLRRRKGKIEEEVCLTYRVYSKLLDETEIKAAGSKPIPKEAHGYPTDVLLIKESRPSQCPDDPGAPTGDRGTRQENPLVGGTSSTVLSDWHSFPTGYGTLGGICFDRSTGDEMALSNAHVWGEETGKDVIQPWMPVDEYLEAAVKLFLCGATAYLFDLVVPSPATIGLGAAAAGAWIAACASDEEDPARWGQRETGVPPGGARTYRESIRLRAEVPPVPMAGRAYTTKTTWDYMRITDQGDKSATVTKDRSNQHVLLAKRVWTDEPQYGRGSRVQICAELLTKYRRKPEDYMVVAHCFPKSNPEDVYKRILKPGQCKVRHKRTWSFYGFPHPAKPGEQAPRQIEVDAFQIGTTEATVFYGPIPRGDSNPVTALRIPADGLHCAVPPCTKVIVKVLHTNKPIKIEAFNAAGLQTGQATGTDDEGVVQELTIDTFEITTLKITGGGGEGYLLGITAEQTYTSGYDKKFQHLYYRGTLDLGLEVDLDEWGIVLYVQTVDNSGRDSKPIVAAQNIGGIVTSANIAVIGCTAVMLLDHVFDVI
jgi:hypothetical protein